MGEAQREAGQPVSAEVAAYVDAAVGAAFVLGGDGRIRRSNRHAESLFGYAPDELQGRSVESLVPEEARLTDPAGPAATGIRSIGSGLEVIALRRDGSQFHADVAFSARSEDDEFLLLVDIKEVSERDRIEAMVTVDATGLIRVVNLQAESLLGYGAAELIGRHVDALIPEDARAAHAVKIREFVAHRHTRPQVGEFELVMRRKDDAVVPVDISLSVVDAEGSLFISATIRDISDRKRVCHAILRGSAA